MGAAPTGSRIERYLAHLDRLTGGVEPQFLPVPTTHKGLKGLTVLHYADLPEPVCLTAVTYGLSLAEHAEWRAGKPELTLSVRSRDEMWSRAMGHIAEEMRGRCPFSYGNTIDFGDQVSTGSGMTAFVVFAPASLDRADFLGIDVGDVLPVNLSGLYPIHESERQFIQKHGLEAFWKMDWDPYDVTRSPVA